MATYILYRTSNDGGEHYLSVPDSPLLEVRNAVDAVYEALAAESARVDTAALTSALERSIGIEGTELDAFLPDKELRIVLPRLKLEGLDNRGVMGRNSIDIFLFQNLSKSDLDF